MSVPTDAELFESVRSGTERAFEQIYDRYHERVRLVAWRVSHRPDWIDEICNEAWCRAFKSRMSFDASRPFLVWMGGILNNVYREHCRASPTTAGESLEPTQKAGSDNGTDPERLAAEAELLTALNECMGQLTAEDARLVRLRFFDGMTLRSVAKELSIPESTVREQRLPDVMNQLRLLLKKKGIEF
jgi:RNA polymerase sigma-70 factor (ECF subfamily)